jgi:hypothetical protein
MDFSLASAGRIKDKEVVTIKMAKIVCSGNDIGFTILPYTLGTPANHSDYMLGYVTNGKFTYTESGGLTEANHHWSLDIIKNFAYSDKECSWIVYACSPRKTAVEFSKILKNSHETLHIYNWDTWSVEVKDSKVVVVTCLEIF